MPASGTRATCAVRPERIRIAAGDMPADASADNMLKGRVSKRIFAGNSSTYFVERGHETLKVVVQNNGGERLAEGQDVTLRWDAQSTVLISAPAS